MKIAIIAPPFESTPPERYGGTERIVSLISEGLVERGHDVTLFATGSSRTNGKLISYFEKPVRPYNEDAGVLHAVLSLKEIERGNFDIIHNHNWNYACLSELVDTPMVTTLHNDRSDLFKYKIFQDLNLNFVSVSSNQAKMIRALGTNIQFVIHNAIDHSQISLSGKKENYVAFLGDVAKYKGAHLAVEAAIKSHIKLKIAGKLFGNESFFNLYIKPYIQSKQVEYVGELNDSQKYKFLSQAKGLLFPVTWEEPFGLVVVESLACGTPVISFDKGAIREIFENGKQGYIVENIEEMSKKIPELEKISLKACILQAQKFNINKMIDSYVDVYKQILGAR